MQLNPKSAGTAAVPGPARRALGAAAAALLAAGPALAQGSSPSAPPPALADNPVTWQADAAVLVYQESGGRVKAVEPIVALKRSDGNDRISSARLTLDTLSGASPTGAAPQPQVQVITSASGQSSYATQAGAVPMDNAFKDRRTALALSHEQPIGPGRRISLGANGSGETDFASVSVSAALAQDFNDRNSTLSVGLAYEYDYIKPVGRTPAPLQPHTAAFRLGSSQTRTVVDLLLGYTQVINRRWVSQFNIGPGWGEGYFSDPYKVLSVVNGVTGLEVGDGKVSESRPRERRRLSLYWQNKVHVDSGVVDVAVRRYSDNWDIRSTTLDARYRHELGGGWFVEPQWRGYRQSAARFYRAYLVEGVDYLSDVRAPTLPHASADARLGSFSAQTLGLKLGLELAQGREFTLRVASYHQKAKAVPGAPGYLATVPLVDDLKATMVLAGYSHLF